jgi:hypothetical protein
MYKHLLVVTLILLGYMGMAQANSLTVSGVYQGKDLYVKNPAGQDGIGFCVYEVYVNGQLTSDEINSSAFAIDFSILGIERGQAVTIEINHKEDCGPIVLNPEAIKPHSTFNVVDMEVSSNTLKWTTKDESGSLPFIVEQFRWNKWVEVGTVPGAGAATNQSYSFDLKPYSGENKVRIKQVDYTGKPRYSESKSYDPGLSPVTFSPEKPESTITFSRETLYEIFDKYGRVVKTGAGKTVDVSELKGGESYYLNYDSSFGETFTKKK